ncbi:MAG TPA: potassium channel family protein [Arenimonas sp.]|nr:potassium channel family protein [Arenimonas sp.]
MYPHWGANAAVVVATVVSVGAVVLLHYEGLALLLRWLSQRHESQRRRKVLYGIWGVLALHIIEIWLFGLAFWGLSWLPGTGSVAGAHPLQLLDAVYLAAMSYTTVGFGDVAPVGAIRFLAGTVAVTGLVLITWSASFTYLEMERYWRR